MKLYIVPARQGQKWVTSGIRTFCKKPLLLTGAFVMLLTLITVLSTVPVLGVVLATVPVPILTLNSMFGAHQINQGQSPSPLILLRNLYAEPKKLGALLLLGFCSAIALALAIGLSALIDGGQMASMYLNSEPNDMANNIRYDASLLVATGVFFVVELLLSILFWHAPALIYWHNLPTFKAMFFSAAACLSNFRALLVFGLLWFALILGMGLASIILASIGTLAGSSSALGLSVAILVVGGAVLCLALATMTMYFTSIYFTYLDCFRASPDNTTQLT